MDRNEEEFQSITFHELLFKFNEILFKMISVDLASSNSVFSWLIIQKVITI